MASTAHKTHWTQRPENKEKLKLLGKQRWSGKSNGKAPATSSLLDEHQQLLARISTRIAAVNETIAELEAERRSLAALVAGKETGEAV